MWFLVIVALVASNAVACGKDCIEYHGTCACEEKPWQLSKAEEVQPSDEKPPKDKMPSYQREGIHADMPVSTAGQDALLDSTIRQADSEGKKAAGI